VLFRHRLALALGMTYSRMMHEMTSKELTRWGEYFKVEPFGDREVMRTIATISHMYYHRNADASKPRGMPVDFFMPGYVAPDESSDLATNMKKSFKKKARR
jgi:hypothetical protein